MSELRQRPLVDGTILNSDDVLSTAYDASENLLTQLLSVGFRTVMLIVCDWVQEHVDPVAIALRLGLHVQTKNLNELMPVSLFLRPLVDMRSQVENILSYIIQGELPCMNLAVIRSVIMVFGTTCI